MTAPGKRACFDYSDKIDILLEKTNPFAIITAAHLKTKATKNNPQERYTWKWAITRAFYEKGFSTKDILSLYRIVDWLMMLPDLTKQFTQNLIERLLLKKRLQLH